MACQLFSTLKVRLAMEVSLVKFRIEEGFFHLSYVKLFRENICTEAILMNRSSGAILHNVFFGFFFVKHFKVLM